MALETVLGACSWLLAAAHAAPLSVVAVECILAKPDARSVLDPSIRRPAARVAIVVPAYNEASTIADAVHLLKGQMRHEDRLLVVADNCTDGTAERAGRAGAEVIERHNSASRGKGFAIEAGVDHLRSNAPDVVLFIDADCQFTPGSIEALVDCVAASGRPAQAVNLVRPRPGCDRVSLISAFAFLVKNSVRPRALSRLGLPVGLTGTGMAFPWTIIGECELGTADIVEDLSLGVRLMADGTGALLCPAANVFSDEPFTLRAARDQRTRWEHGSLGSMARNSSTLISGALSRRRPALALCAVDVMVPPLALVVSSALVAAGVLSALAGAGAVSWQPLALLVSATVFAGLALGVSWARLARDVVPASAFLAVPKYLVAKAAIYRTFLGDRQTDWVRTERSEQTE